MKRIEIVASSEIKVQPFILDDFMQQKDVHRMQKKVTKKELKQVAEEAGFLYSEAEIIFAKKLLNAYLAGK
ncbi:MAG TPA: hypothetical protein VIM88_08070 [Sulfurovum sp.]|uniref:hypothetical protein n=1 Tax=Sulfurovum sp. TaxID=1969726 RepID=UPI002F94DE5A